MIRKAILATTAALLGLAASPRAQAFSLGSIEDLLDGIGLSIDLPEVTVDLPPVAEDAVASTLDVAEGALDNVFGEGGVLEGIDVDTPPITVPDVDQIVDDALARANEILDGIELPEVDVTIPDVEALVDDALSRAQAEVDAALQKADDALEDLDLDGVVEEAIDHARGVLDEILGEAGPVGSAVPALSVVELSMDSQAFHAESLSTVAAPPVEFTAAAIPEPAGVALLFACLTAGAIGRRG